MKKKNPKPKPLTQSGQCHISGISKGFVLKMPCTNDKSASQQGGNLEVIKVNEIFSIELGFCLKIFMLLFQ